MPLGSAAASLRARPIRAHHARGERRSWNGSRSDGRRCLRKEHCVDTTKAAAFALRGLVVPSLRAVVRAQARRGDNHVVSGSALGEEQGLVCNELAAKATAGGDARRFVGGRKAGAARNIGRLGARVCGFGIAQRGQSLKLELGFALHELLEGVELVGIGICAQRVSWGAREDRRRCRGVAGEAGGAGANGGVQIGPKMVTMSDL